MLLIQFISIQLGLIALYGVYQLLKKGINHLNFNRCFLLLTPLVIPFFMLFRGEMTSVSQLNVVLPTIEISNLTMLSEGIHEFNWVLFIWGTGATVAFSIFLAQVFRVKRQKVLKELTQIGRIKVYLIDNKNDSYSFLNKVFISETQLEYAEYILDHEVAHCAQKHSVDLLYFSVIKALFWFNPIVYLWEKEMKENHEFLADKEALNETNFSEYSHVLLSSCLGAKIPALSSGFNKKSMLRKRIIQLKSKNKFTMKHVMFVPVVLGVALATMSFKVDTKAIDSSPKTFISHKGEGVEPTYPGGTKAMTDFIISNIKYPKTSAKAGEQGKVYVSFDVDADGSLENIKVAKSSGFEALDDEAIRIVNKMPKWEAGSKDGKKVKAKMTVPFQFNLTE